MTAETTIYTVRPDGTALWLPSILAQSLGHEWGARLTVDEFNHHDIQGLIERRVIAEKSRKK